MSAMQDSMLRKFKSKMEELHAYLNLVKDNIPTQTLRQGLSYALHPVGIRVDINEDPLFIPTSDRADSYNMTSPLKRGRYHGGSRRKTKKIGRRA
jgi:hypothetical protein